MEDINIAIKRSGEAVMMSDDYIIYCENKTSLDRVKSALRKIYITQKPGFNGKNFICPTCHKEVSAPGTQKKQKWHCVFCGQKIAWRME